MHPRRQVKLAWLSVLRARIAKGLGPNLRQGARGGNTKPEGQRKFHSAFVKMLVEGTGEELGFGLKVYIYICFGVG